MLIQFATYLSSLHPLLLAPTTNKLINLFIDTAAKYYFVVGMVFHICEPGMGSKHTDVDVVQ